MIGGKTLAVAPDLPALDEYEVFRVAVATSIGGLGRWGQALCSVFGCCKSDCDGKTNTYKREVWMPNHIHTLIQTPEPNLASGMQHWLSGYANGYAKRNRRTGHLYQGRYKAFLVEDAGYYWTLRIGK